MKALQSTGNKTFDLQDAEVQPLLPGKVRLKWLIVAFALDRSSRKSHL